MRTPLNRREFDVFLSHAHTDHEFVAALDRWLTVEAGFSVWFDGRELGGGSLLATDLQEAMDRCRSIVLVASQASAESGWVQSEYNSAMDERANVKGFKVVALRMPGADVSKLMKGLTWIDVPQAGFTAETAQNLLRAFYPGKRRPNSKTRDVYLSGSWRDDSWVPVAEELSQSGIRLIGDDQDQVGFGDGDRVRRIMASCGAFVCVVPFRGVEEATALEGPYKYFMRELDQAAELGLFRLVIADGRIKRKDGPDEDWLRMDLTSKSCSDEVSVELGGLWHEWKPPNDPHYIFFAADLDSPAAEHASPIRHMVERVTGMPTVIGNEIHGNPLHAAILERIQGAFLVLADITDDNLNSCIEAGMGLAANRNVEIMAKGPARRPPFMLRSLQFSHYSDDLTHLGLVHRLVRPYRRRVINAEL